MMLPQQMTANQNQFQQQNQLYQQPANNQLPPVPPELEYVPASTESLMEEKKTDMMTNALKQERQELTNKAMMMLGDDENDDEDSEEERQLISQTMIEGMVPEEVLMKAKFKLEEEKRKN